jgi:hypothetical protein
VTSPLRIFLLKDNAADAELIREFLEAEYIVCDLTRVQTRAGTDPRGVEVIARADPEHLVERADATHQSDEREAARSLRASRPSLPPDIGSAEVDCVVVHFGSASEHDIWRATRRTKRGCNEHHARDALQIAVEDLGTAVWTTIAIKPFAGFRRAVV